MSGFWPWFWAQVWPNLFASFLCGIPATCAFVWHHVRLSRRLSAHGEQLREAHRLLAELHAKHGPDGGGHGGPVRG